MARGYEGAFGRKLNAPYVWIPLCLLFLAPFVDPRRPFRLLHLDLLVLLAFGVSHVFFNRGEIATSVPLVYPVLLYLLVRMLLAGFRPRERRGPARAARAAHLAGGGARVPRRLPDRPERGRLERDRRGLRGRDRRRPDRRRPPPLRPGLRRRQRARRHLRPGGLPALRAVRAGAAVERALGRPAGGARGGDRVRPAHRCSGCSGSGGGSDPAARAPCSAWRWPTRGRRVPYTAFALESNSNDSLVALALVAALLALTLDPARRRLSAVARGAAIGLGAAAKFAPWRWRRCSPRPGASGAGARRRCSSPRGRAADRGHGRAVRAGRRPARALRPHARLPGRPALAVQHLGPAPRPRLAPDRRQGRRCRARLRGGVRPAAQDRAPGGRAGGGDPDRAPAGRHALVLPLRGVVPAGLPGGGAGRLRAHGGAREEPGPEPGEARAPAPAVA